MTRPKKEKFSVYCTKQEKKKLEALAEEADRSLAYIVNLAIKHFLNNQDKSTPLSSFAQLDEASHTLSTNTESTETICFMKPAQLPEL